MPQGRISHDLVPWRDSRNWGIHDDKSLNLFWIERGIGVGDHDADVVRNHRCSIMPERHDDCSDVGGLGPFVVASRGAGRASDATQVGNYDGVAGGKIFGQGCPGIARFGVTMKEDDNWS